MKDVLIPDNLSKMICISFLDKYNTQLTDVIKKYLVRSGKVKEKNLINNLDMDVNLPYLSLTLFRYLGNKSF